LKAFDLLEQGCFTTGPSYIKYANQKGKKGIILSIGSTTATILEPGEEANLDAHGAQNKGVRQGALQRLFPSAEVEVMNPSWV
jgi:hypothetical protein